LVDNGHAATKAASGDDAIDPFATLGWPRQASALTAHGLSV